MRRAQTHTLLNKKKRKKSFVYNVFSQQTVLSKWIANENDESWPEKRQKYWDVEKCGDSDNGIVVVVSKEEGKFIRKKYANKTKEMRTKLEKDEQKKKIDSSK